MGEEIRHPDGRVELADPAALASSPLYSHDLAPVPVAKRTWSTYDFAALWVSMAHCIPTYNLAALMIASGLAWWQALTAILLGNLIVLVPILLNSHPGTKYGIPFPVFARAAYGTTGANLPALMRALVACGWFGINAWIGGAALQAFFASLWPGWNTLLGTADYPFANFPNTAWISFLLFWGLNILVIFRGMDLLRRVERWAAPYVLIMTGLLLGWAIWKAGGLGSIVEESSFHGKGTFFAAFIPALTGTVSFWSTLSLNMPDFTRFGRSQKEQMVGQTIALPTTMTVFAAMGILITSATAVIYKVPIWDPIELGAKFDSRIIVGIAMFTAVVATLAVNIAANVVSPANDFANAFPKRVDFKRGGLITGIIGIAMCPWELLKDADRYINGWLNGYGGALGSIAGVLAVDYWIIRKTELDLVSLYRPGGKYPAWNPPAVIATLVGSGIAFAGAFVPALSAIYHWSWFIGTGSAALVYLGLQRR